MASQSSDVKLALTRERILAEAVAFADEEGVDALSMRKLADRVGAGAMSLYTHVANKDDLLEAMVDLVAADIVLPAAGGDGDWRQTIGTTAESAHQVLLAHPWMAVEWTNRVPGPARLQFMEAILRTLTVAGLDQSLVYRGYHAITMHVVGFTIQELGYQRAGGGPDLSGLAQGFLDQLADANLPYLADHLRAHLDPHDHGDEFGFVLGLILDGLERANNS